MGRAKEERDRRDGPPRVSKYAAKGRPHAYQRDAGGRVVSTVDLRQARSNRGGLRAIFLTHAYKEGARETSVGTLAQFPPVAEAFANDRCAMIALNQNGRWMIERITGFSKNGRRWNTSTTRREALPENTTAREVLSALQEWCAAVQDGGDPIISGQHSRARLVTSNTFIRDDDLEALVR